LCTSEDNALRKISRIYAVFLGHQREFIKLCGDELVEGTCNDVLPIGLDACFLSSRRGLKEYRRVRNIMRATGKWSLYPNW
jgi:hypothetical protein